MKRWLPLLALAAVLGVLYAERRGQPRLVETHADAPGIPFGPAPQAPQWTWTTRPQIDGKDFGLS